MENYDIHRVVSILREEVKTLKEPIVTKIAKKKDPFRVLISTVISLRTKDKTTEEASERLFEAAHTPRDMLTLPITTIEKLIYPAGFYKVKAMNIHNISKMIVEDSLNGTLIVSNTNEGACFTLTLKVAHD